MKLPGVQFLRDQRAVKAFERQDPSFKDLVFYSEGAADWPHLGPIVQALLRDHDHKFSYLTSDPADPGLAIVDERYRAFDIGAGTARTILFARMDCRRFVMTLPDLGQLWLKRSVHPVEYVYVFHSMNSTHTSYRKGAFDHFDTVLCVGPHHVEEIRKTEEVYGLPPKQLVEHGSVKLDSILAEVADRPAPARTDGETTILVAPTWGESSLMERPVGRDLIATLLNAGFRTVLRLHPMTGRRMPRLVAELRRTFGGDRRFVLEEDMSAVDSWLASDVMVSDWSGAATEYAFALLKPVIYVDTPPKIMNAEWQRIGLRSFEERVRDEVGVVVSPHRVDRIPDAIRSSTAEAGTTTRAADARLRALFTIGRSSELAAAHLVSAATRG